MSWLKHHSESERLASIAEAAKRESLNLYRQAAEAETKALEALGKNKIRTLGITVVSATALYYKAGEYEEARDFAIRWIKEPLLPPFATEQLEELLDQCHVAEGSRPGVHLPGKLHEELLNQPHAIERERKKGIVKWFSPQKGYGFIAAEHGENIFVHYGVISWEGYESLDEGESVSFEVTQGPKGPQATNVSRLIDDLSDLGKVEAGKPELHLKPFALGECAQEVARAISPLCEQKKLSLSVEISPDLPQLTGDYLRIKKVLLSLLRNSVKFTERGGIAVRAFPKGKWIAVQVEDTGIGISESDLPRLFEPFRQLNPRSPDEHGGSGLGLAVAKKLIEMHGGKISVESKPGEGSVFTFLLPLNLASSQDPRGDSA
jgi:cold shock CspA family protein/anti-sigma regulatory factor (Ser/Thr protein kinase)